MAQIILENKLRCRYHTKLFSVFHERKVELIRDINGEYIILIKKNRDNKKIVKMVLNPNDLVVYYNKMSSKHKYTFVVYSNNICICFLTKTDNERSLWVNVINEIQNNKFDYELFLKQRIDIRIDIDSVIDYVSSTPSPTNELYYDSQLYKDSSINNETNNNNNTNHNRATIFSILNDNHDSMSQY
mmetsp:Transcript_77531/g.95016  ORF Transcript_77531/g.95016 Transcript_77531/m.95016 type:complete len:186 (-) Transcript_77531:227-784(-)